MRYLALFLFCFVASSQIGQGAPQVSPINESEVVNSLNLNDPDFFELQVKYDVALAENNVESMSILLRKMGLYYYNENMLKRAEGYIWRSKIIAENNDLLQQDLYSCALLSKINLGLGNFRASIEFEEEYLSILSRIGQSNSATNSFATPSKVDEIVSESSGFPLFPVFLSLGLVLLLLGILYGKRITPQTHNLKNEEHKEERIVSVEKKVKTELFDIDINVESLNIIDFAGDEFVEGQEEPEFILRQKSKVAVDEVSPVPEIKNPMNLEVSDESIPDHQPIQETEKLVVDAILAARSAGSGKQIVKPPLWVSSMEHHFNGINLIKGVRVAFNHAGDFKNIEIKTQDNYTDFVKSFIDELIDSNNVLNVNGSLVSTSVGLVLKVDILPITNSNPVLPSSTLSYFSGLVSENYSIEFTANQSALQVILKGNDLVKNLSLS